MPRTSKRTRSVAHTQSTPAPEESITVGSPPLEGGYEYPSPPQPALSGDPFDSLLRTQPLPESGPESAEVQPTKTDQKTESQGSLKVAWTYEMEEGLFTTLLDKARKGKRADSGFKQEVWVDALNEVRLRAPDHIRDLLTLDKLKNKESNYKALYKDWKWLTSQSGFGRHPDTGVVTASKEAWEEVLKVCFLMALLPVIANRIASQIMQKASF